jgi:hypothetical protein
LETLTAIGTEMKVDGTTYRLRDLDREDWGLIEERIKAGRPDPIAIAQRLAKDAAPENAQAIYDRAYSDAMKAAVVAAEDIDAWMVTPKGLEFLCYLQIRKDHPKVTEERASELLLQFTREHNDRHLAELRKRFPDATAVELMQALLQLQAAGVEMLISKAMGLPAGNLPTPAGPGTPASQSTGSDGTLS